MAAPEKVLSCVSRSRHTDRAFLQFSIIFSRSIILIVKDSSRERAKGKKKRSLCISMRVNNTKSTMNLARETSTILGAKHSDISLRSCLSITSYSAVWNFRRFYFYKSSRPNIREFTKYFFFSWNHFAILEIIFVREFEQVDAKKKWKNYGYKIESAEQNVFRVIISGSLKK